RYLAAQPISRTSRPGPVRPRDGALPYLPGLDGLRALAVAAVLLYHLEVGWLRGGFLGVEVFFVLSGYLITSLLLAEWRRARAIDLKAFWLRRARRLLPALYLLLIGTLAYAIAFLPDELARLRRDALAAFAYVTNWYLIFGHTSYFEAIGRPSLLQHLWSLAVEEQFYLLWPPLFLVLMRRGRRWALAACLAGALASTALMAALFDPGVDPSRLYYGTDTRAAELLLGAALAFVWDPVRLGDPARARGRLRRWLAAAPHAALALDGAAAVALLALVGLFHALGEIEPRLYRGGFAVVALVTLVLIAATAHPRARWAPRLIGCRPLRWVGQRSYGIYLWHWPVFMVTRPGLDVPLAGLPLLALRLAVTVGLAEASYRWVETPFRRGAVGRAWRAWREAEGPRRRWV
ncbi:MAG: acyltransferase, partial [Thermomicrobiaceae bacterium]|nr:acyltransferase [Thermomicrobiaceae bacterium]